VTITANKQQNTKFDQQNILQMLVRASLQKAKSGMQPTNKQQNFCQQQI